MKEHQARVAPQFGMPTTASPDQPPPQVLSTSPEHIESMLRHLIGPDGVLEIRRLPPNSLWPIAHSGNDHVLAVLSGSLVATGAREIVLSAGHILWIGATDRLTCRVQGRPCLIAVTARKPFQPAVQITA